MIIRKGTLRDFEQVYALLPQLWPGVALNKRRLRLAFTRALRSRRQYYLCAVEKEKLLGFCSLSIRSSLWQQGPLAHTDELVVDTAHRRQGIGTRLIAEAMKAAKRSGCSRLELDSAFHRAHAHAFYKGRGFENRAYLFSKRIKGRPGRGSES